MPIWIAIKTVEDAQASKEADGKYQYGVVPTKAWMLALVTSMLKKDMQLSMRYPKHPQDIVDTLYHTLVSYSKQ